jgi:hypothetical protein
MCAQRCCSGDLAEPLGGKYVGKYVVESDYRCVHTVEEVNCTPVHMCNRVKHARVKWQI